MTGKVTSKIAARFSFSILSSISLRFFSSNSFSFVSALFRASCKHKIWWGFNNHPKCKKYIITHQLWYTFISVWTYLPFLHKKKKMDFSSPIRLYYEQPTKQKHFGQFPSPFHFLSIPGLFYPTYFSILWCVLQINLQC